MFWNRLWITFWVSLFLSVDDFAVGTAYGLRNCMVPVRNVAVMVVGSTLSMTISMLLGKLFLGFLNEWSTQVISASLLCGLGIWMIVKTWREGVQTGWQMRGHLKLSSAIHLWEWFYLGAALGVDDFAEAFGLAVAGFPVALTIVLFKLSELIMILSGMWLGCKGLSKHINGKLGLVPGVVLILVGIKQLF